MSDEKTYAEIAEDIDWEADGISEAYAEWLMTSGVCDGSRLICNGDTLIGVMEECYCWEGFQEYWIELQEAKKMPV